MQRDSSSVKIKEEEEGGGRVLRRINLMRLRRGVYLTYHSCARKRHRVLEMFVSLVALEILLY